MKRWIGVLILLIVLVLAGLYVLIPGRMSFQVERDLHVNARAFRRIMMDTGSRNWWPGERNNNKLRYRGKEYFVSGITVNSLFIDQVKEGDTLPTELLVVPASKDEVMLTWKGSRDLSLLPWERWAGYGDVRSCKNDMKAILDSIETRYSDPKHLYEADIREEHVKDSILVSTYSIAKDSPDIKHIYAMIDQLHGYVLKNRARETGPPMLNITKNEAGFRTQVALPVDRRLPDEGAIQYKWMLGGGNILVTEVHGGPAAIARAMQQLDLYVSDHNRVAPAISFQSLVTDRRAEKDTGKWVTRVYYPVM